MNPFVATSFPSYPTKFFSIFTMQRSNYLGTGLKYIAVLINTKEKCVYDYFLHIYLRRKQHG